MEQISFPKHRKQKINFEKLSGEQVCKSAIAIRFNLLQVGPSDASLFFYLLPYLFLLFMLWAAIFKFYSVCWWYPRDRQVAGELSVVSYCSELASGELQDIELSKSCRPDLEFSKCCRQDLEFSKSCRQALEFSKCFRHDLKFSKSCRQDLEFSKSCRQDLEFSKSIYFKYFYCVTRRVSIKGISGKAISSHDKSSLFVPTRL